MMTCKEIAELLMAYCDGELTQEHCDGICQHVRVCVTCHHFMETYKCTVRMCRDLPMAALPEHLLDRLRAAVKEMGKGPCGR
jgi:hypothetical protein